MRIEGGADSETVCTYRCLGGTFFFQVSSLPQQFSPPRLGDITLVQDLLQNIHQLGKVSGIRGKPTVCRCAAGFGDRLDEFSLGLGDVPVYAAGPIPAADGERR